MTIDVPAKYDLRRTVEFLTEGPRDPTARRDGARNWKVERNADGVATWCVESVGATSVRFRAWGPGAQHSVARAPDILGLADNGVADWDPDHRLIRDLVKRFGHLRFTRSAPVMDMLLPAILGQRVHGRTAVDNYRQLSYKFGGLVPGPPEVVKTMAAPPEPKVLAAIPVWELHTFQIERSRARTVVAACAVANRLNEAGAMSSSEAYTRLTALPGIGAWTASSTLLRTHGDADAVPIGDYHMPNTVAFGLAGEARGNDLRMLELLEPFRPHRYRVIQWLGMAGLSAPRRGPRRGSFHEELKPDPTRQA